MPLRVIFICFDGNCFKDDVNIFVYGALIFMISIDLDERLFSLYIIQMFNIVRNVNPVLSCLEFN